MVAIIALGLNLRPAVNSTGSLLPEIRAALDLSGAAGGALTSLPPFCFALLGLVAPLLARRFQPQRVVVVSLLVMTCGQFLRIVGPSVVVLFAGSMLTLAGLAICNVLLPSLIRRFFPARIPTMTAVYTTSLAVGATAASGLTVPFARALDADWRTGLGVWALTAAIALVPWVMMLFRHLTPSGAAAARPRLPVSALVRSPVAWKLGVFFGLQSTQAYVVTAWLSQIVVDGGADLATGGFAIAVFAGLGIPISAAVPALLVRESRLPVIVVVLGGCYVAGYLGLAADPVGGLWAWAILLGVGSGTFPLCLTLIALRARTPEGVAALSAFTQCLGYLIASGGPLLIGWMHDLTGGWTIPILIMAASAALMAVMGLQVARSKMVEDDLRLP